LMIATACVPPIFKDNESIKQARTDFAQSLNDLLLPILASSSSSSNNNNKSIEIEEERIIHDPMTSLGSGSLGYYLIYTGHNDVFIRRLLASVYWNFSPSLKFTAPFLLATESGSGHVHHHQIKETSSNSMDIINTSMERKRIRVGFVCSFFYRHSVGLLTQGVITGLATQRQDQFHVSLIYPVPHPDESDKVFQRLSEVVHKLVQIPKGNLVVSRSVIAAEKLDVLIYAEVALATYRYIYFEFPHIYLSVCLFFLRTTFALRYICVMFFFYWTLMCSISTV
jgi:hypothetical protein